MISYRNYLVLTAFVCGTIIMVIELIGARVIGPSFGVSLFVWTSLITVTLVALALGYWIGGKFADKKDNPSTLFTLIIASGLYLLLIPAISGMIIGWCLTLGLRAGALISSVVLFGPPLFLLGMVSPYIVKLYFSEKDGLGKTVGWLYAISTTGSFVGTISTGFILIPAMGIDNIIYLSAFVLLSISIGYFLIFRKKFLFLPLALIPIALMFLPKPLPTVIRPDGTKVEVIYREDSFYGQIKVVDYSYGNTRLRELLVDNMAQGGIDVNTNLSVFTYSYEIEFLARAYKRDAKSALIIGLGAGIIPTRLAKHYGINCDIVEIDPLVVDTSVKYFFLDPEKFSIYVEDGRYFLQRSKKLYDIIVLDTFSGDTQPSHLMSLEVFGLVGSRLNKEGILLINYVGSTMDEESVVLPSLYRTLKEVFPFVDIYSQSYDPQNRPPVINYTIVAYKKEVKTLEPPAIITPVYGPIEDYAAAVLSRKASIQDGPFILRDNYNPIDFYDLKVRERFRNVLIRTADKEIVVN